MELNSALGALRSSNDSLREELAADGSRIRNLAQDDRTRESSANLNAKFTLLTQGQNAHTLVGGIELEGVRRNESSVLTETRFRPGPVLPDDGLDELSASSTRIALYGQDEFRLNPKWALHAGLRTETIEVSGEAADGTRPSNRSSVTTPLLHLLYKPNPQGRDQVRLSLTRSYRSPSLGNLIAKPRYSTRYPVSGPNLPSGADRLGNPALLPELASGLDLAIERYLQGGGVLSANLFARRISNLIRSSTELETVSYSPVPRYVSRPKNIGDANTYGIELEARFRLDQLIAAAPRIETRANASFYRSDVKSIPGPDNRLDGQSPASVNLGADYRFRGTSFTMGGNLNWTPAYRTQTSAEQSQTVPVKHVWDAFVLYSFTPNTALRLLGSNLNPRDYVTGSERIDPGLREVTSSRQPGDVNWQLRLELKL
jgi:outer membrane receptor for ferrienterochelin and colicins